MRVHVVPIALVVSALIVGLLGWFVRGWIASLIGRDELTLAVGLVLVTVSLWPVLGAGALLPAGIVLLWLGLPARTGFIRDRRPSDPRRK